MQKKMYIFRCPVAEFEEIERICAENHTDHSRVVNAALLLLTDFLAEQGLLPPRELPPCCLPPESSGDSPSLLTPVTEPNHG